MPPPGVPHPDARRSRACSRGSSAVSTPRPVLPIPAVRCCIGLNRTEYRNAIRDLLALDIGDVAALLPPDDSAYGFDTIADFLGVSQVLLERYLSAAGRISALAVGDVDVVPGSETYPARQDLSQDKHLDGMPFGTVGGVMANHTFPVDGDYVLQATLYRTNVDQTRGLELPHQLEMTVDGERVFLETIGGTPPGNPGGADEAATGRGRLLSRSDAIDARLQVRVHVKAGPRAVTAAFLQRSRGADPRKLQPYRSSFDTYDATGVPHIETLVVEGPVQRRVGGRDAQPCARVRVPAGDRGAGRAVRAADPLVAGAPRLPAAGLGRRRGARRWSSTAPAARAAASSRASSWRCSASWPARSSCCASSAIPPRCPPAPPTASATSSWRRACRSSCGAASRTTSC